MPRTNEALDIMCKVSSSPYKPELPRRSFVVSLFMKLGQFTKRGGYVTPHLSGGSNLSKVEWEYDAGYTFFESINEYITIDALDNKDILDVGCGWGGKAIYFAEHSKLKTIYGFDLPNVYIPDVSTEFALKKDINNCFFKTCYAENMTYNDNAFDVIIMEDVLEHVSDPVKVMEECYRVLRPKGRVIVKFPSFLMMGAHHLDRALNFPGLHYILPMKKWASGLNYLLLNSEKVFSYEPFSEVVSTKYCKSITRDLNGLDFDNFKKIIENINFKTNFLGLIPYNFSIKRRKIVRIVYNLAYNVSSLREFLSSFILFIGEK